MSSIHEGKFYELFQVYIQGQVYHRSKYQKIRSKVRSFYKKESREDSTLGARHTSSVVDITLDNWCNQSRRTYQTTNMI